MKIKLLFLSLIVAMNTFAQTNYYVDKLNGNDSNAGTTIGTAWKTIQKAGNSATPNSIVNIKAATYYENVVINVIGTLGNSITFKNYLNDIVIIDGTGTSGTILLKITNKSYLNFQNLTIANKTINDAQGVLVETTGNNSCTDLSFKNIIIKNINWTSNAATVPNANKNAQGFIAYGRNGGIKNLTVEECEVSNCILGFSEALAINGNIDGFSVKNCNVHDNTNIGIDILGHEGTASPASIDEARNGIVSGNVCYNNVSNYATSAGIYVDGANNVIIERNKCYSNGWGIEVGAELDGIVSNIRVKNNLIYNNQQAGLSIGGYDTGTTGQVKNCIIRNNTFFNNNTLNDGTGEISITKASDCVFENNIFYTNAQNVLMSVDNISPQTGNKFNYNSCYTPNNNANNITVNWRTTSYSTFSSYKIGTQQEANSTYQNPNFVSSNLQTPNLQLMTNSPCINSGKQGTVIEAGELDYDGNTRISNTIIDIGAYEKGSVLDLKDNEEIKLSNNNTKIFPIPASDTITILVDDTNGGTLTMYDLSGKLVLENKLNEGKNSIDILGFKNGIYFLNINSSNKFTVSRIIISR